MSFASRKISKSFCSSNSLAAASAFIFVFFIFGFSNHIVFAQNSFFSGETGTGQLHFSGALPSENSDKLSQETIFNEISIGLILKNAHIQNSSIAMVTEQTHYAAFFEKNQPKSLKTIAYFNTLPHFSTKKQSRLDITMQRIRFLCFPASVYDTKT